MRVMQVYQVRLIDLNLEHAVSPHGLTPECHAPYIYIYFFSFKSETSLSLVLGLIRTHNLLIFGQTTKLSCLEARQEDSGSPKL